VLKTACNTVLPKALRPLLGQECLEILGTFSVLWLKEKGRSLVRASKCKTACVFKYAIKIYFGS